MTRVLVKLIFIITLMLTFSNLSAPSSFASTANNVVAAEELFQSNLLIYDDPRFDFSISYPSDWQVNQRTDEIPTNVEALSFIGPESEGYTPVIYIGHYLIDISQNLSLHEWVHRYPQALPIQVISSRTDEVDNHEAYFISGESAATKFQYLNIRNGNMVWFVWANFNETSDQKYNQIFENMKTSLNLGDGFPQQIQDIYGENFKPLPLPLERAQIDYTRETSSVSARSSQWDVPLYGTWTVNCGSPYHTNGASHAADVGAYQYTNVVAARGGSILFSGWDNSGYGNLIKLSTNGYYHYYAHLQTIHSGNFTNGWYAAKDVHIGDVGGTGGVPIHLHFHIQTGSTTQSSATGVNLSGFLVGFTANSNYPSNYAACGTTSR